MNDKYKQLVIETAVNRLVLRALLASLFVSGGDQGQRLAKAVLAAAEAMAPHALRLEGLDIITQTEVVDLLRKRMMAMLGEFENLDDHSASNDAIANGTESAARFGT